MLRQIQKAEHASLTVFEAQLHGCAAQHTERKEKKILRLSASI